MRIISGSLKGKILKSPENYNTRPTSDKARSAIFNILEHAPWSFGVINQNIMDIFAGTGAFGLEGLSRGASNCIFVENDKIAQRVLNSNISECKFNDKAKLLAKDALKLDMRPANIQPVDIIFLDPPYNKGLIEPTIQNLIEKQWLNKEAIIIAEAEKKEKIETPNGLELVKQTNYGLNGVWFFKYES